MLHEGQKLAPLLGDIITTFIIICRIEKSTAADFISIISTDVVFPMEMDQYHPGYIIYDDSHALMTSNGKRTHLIAGHPKQAGYKEGVGAKAMFHFITGFTQISQERVVVADWRNNYLRLINCTTGVTSVFSGKCQHSGRGHQEGHPGQFHRPYAVVMDKKNGNQLLITDQLNRAIRAAAVRSESVITFVEDELLRYARHMVQDVGSGVVLSRFFLLVVWPRF